MSGFYVEKELNNINIKFIYSFKSNKWYISRNTIIDLIFNPKCPSSYWSNLRKKYLNQNIDINKYLKTIKCISKDNKKRIQKVFTLDSLTKFIKLIKINDDTLFLFIKNTILELNKYKLELILNNTIKEYMEQNYTKQELIIKIISIINNY